MPITLPVETTLDGRSLDRTAGQVEKRFAKAGKDSGSAFAKGLDDAVAKADPKSAERWTKAYDKVADATGKVRVEEAKLADLRERGAANTKLITQAEALERARRAETRATRDASRAYQDLNTRAGGLFSGIADGIAGTRFGGMINDAQRLSSTFGGMGLATGAAITGVAGLAVGVAAATRKMYELGAQWDDVADGITARTGMMGAELQGVMDQVSRVALDSSSSIAELGNIAGQVTAMMGLSGDQLAEMMAYLGDLNALTGEQTNIRQLAMFYRMFGIAAEDQVDTLNDLYGAFTKTQIPVNDLVGMLVKAGPVFKQFGLDAGQSAGMLASFAEAGIEPEKAITGLNKALAATAKAGKDPVATLAEVTTKIKELADAGQMGQARALAENFFGARNFAPFLDAIATGKLSVDQLSTALGVADKDIREVRASTDDFAQQWDRFKNFLSVELQPVATAVFGALNSQLEWFTGSLRGTIDLLQALNPFSSPQVFQGSSDTYPGQVVTPAMPSPGGGITPPSTGAITGNGLMLENLLSGEPGVAAPPGLTGPQPGASIGEQGDTSGIGGGGSSTITLPYPAEYGAPPQPGESDAQYKARMADIMAQHNLAEAQARVAAAQADDLVAANNALTDARIRADQTAKAYQESLVQQAGIGVPFAEGYGQGPRPGQSASEYSAESSFFQAQQKAAQELAEYNQLLASGTATTTELTLAHNELVEAQRNENEAALRLSETSGKTTEKLGQIGAQLDADLGFSKGLSGIADNITRFVANLAFAPMVGALKGVQATSDPDSKAGSGLAGIIGSAMGFGGSTTTAAPVRYPSVYSRPMAPAAGYGAAPAGAAFNDAALLSSVPAGRYAQVQAADLTQGLGDCSSAVEDLVNILDGAPTAGRSMATGNAAEWLTSRGFLPSPDGQVVPGAFNVGFNRGHMQATLPGGTPFNWGSDASAANRGIGSMGAADPALTQRYYRPVGVGPAPASAGGGGFAPMTPSQLTNPGLTSPTPLRGGGAGTGGLLPGIAGLPQAPSTISGVAPAGGRGEGGLGVAGGLLGTAMGALSSAAGVGGMAVNAMAPGAGMAAAAAADIGIKLAERTAQFAGQAAGIGVGGLLETFSPADSELADPMNSWFGRIVGGMMGATANLPNMAGQAANAPQSQGQGQPAAEGGGSPINVTYNNNMATEDRAGKDLTNHLMAMNSGPGQ